MPTPEPGDHGEARRSMHDGWGWGVVTFVHLDTVSGNWLTEGTKNIVDREQGYVSFSVRFFVD